MIMDNLFVQFFIAIKDSNIESIQDFLKLDSIKNNINTKDNQNMTPLMKAMLKGNTEIIHLLLKHGANPNDYNHKNGMNALMLGINSGGKITNKTIEDLAHYQVNYSMPEFNQYCLLQASHLGLTRIVKKLIEVGASIDEVDQYNNNALIYAIAQGHEDVIDILLQSGIDVEQTNIHREDAMTVAMSHYLAMIPKLVSYDYPLEKINYKLVSSQEAILIKEMLQPFIEKKQFDKTFLNEDNMHDKLDFSTKKMKL